uniref:Reverse transcriptase domain-containing protein n=1 Tax=Acrobeloides nanus TaxID=290746 RepID=A0A914ENN8_9BILA
MRRSRRESQAKESVVCEFCLTWHHKDCADYRELTIEEDCPDQPASTAVTVAASNSNLTHNVMSSDVLDFVNFTRTCRTTSFQLPFNVNSLLDKWHELQVFVENQTPDLILLQKTKLSGKITPHEVRPDGYSMYRRDRTRNGGVAIYAKNHLKPKKHFNFVAKTAEGGIMEFVCVRFEVGGRNFTAASLYRPPKHTLPKIQSFLDEFGDFLASESRTPSFRRSQDPASVLEPSRLLYSSTALYSKESTRKIENTPPWSRFPKSTNLRTRTITDFDHLYPKINARLHDNQFGFRKCRSTVDALMYFNHLVTEGIEESGKGAALFFDVKKASDSVPHKKLLERLQHFDLPANWLRLLQSYLRNRSFQVKIGQSYSSRRSSTSGVPQGSILGPLLFIAYAD